MNHVLSCVLSLSVIRFQSSNHLSLPAMPNTNCVSSTAPDKVRLACNLQQKCSVNAKARDLGGDDPCQDTTKYLQISYRCLAECTPTSLQHAAALTRHVCLTQPAYSAHIPLSPLSVQVKSTLSQNVKQNLGPCIVAVARLLTSCGQSMVEGTKPHARL